MNVDKYGAVNFRNPAKRGVSAGHLSLSGQYLVDSWQNGLLHFLRIITVIQLVELSLVASSFGLPTEVLTDPRSLLILFAPMATIPIFLLALLKPRYVPLVLACFVAFGVVAWLAVALT